MKVFGIHSVRQALMAGTGTLLTIPAGKLNARQAALVSLAEELGCEVQTGDVGGFKGADQGVALTVKQPGLRNESAFTDFLNAGSGSLVLILDGVTDPRNFGACIRSAATFAVDAIVVPKDNAAPLNDAAIKTASGGASMVPVFQVVNLSRAMKKMKDAGYWIVGTSLTEAEPLSGIDLKGRIGLVMGAEDTGIRQKTRDNCDFLAMIPMPVPDLTLNVSVATGICLYEAARQRLQNP